VPTRSVREAGRNGGEGGRGERCWCGCFDFANWVGRDSTKIVGEQRTTPDIAILKDYIWCWISPKSEVSAAETSCAQRVVLTR
jgi:hypothetical protein